MGVRNAWRLLLSFGMSALFLWLAVRQIDWGQTAASLVSVEWALLVGGGAALVVMMVLLAVRSRILLSGAADLLVTDAFAYLMIGYLVNTVMPFRLGDLTRVMLVGRRYALSGSLVFGAVALERGLDLLMVVILAATLLPMVAFPPLVTAGLLSLSFITLIGLLALLTLAYRGERIHTVARRLPRPLQRMVEQGAQIIVRFGWGLRTLRDGKKLARVLAISALGWVLAAVATVAWVHAFRLPAPWFAGMFVLAVVNLGSAIPSSPGGIGIYHYLAVLALSVWVPDKSSALGYAIATHAVGVTISLVLGGWAMLREGLTFRTLHTVSPAFRAQ